jgi:hypothetical protein
VQFCKTPDPNSRQAISRFSLPVLMEDFPPDIYHKYVHWEKQHLMTEPYGFADRVVGNCSSDIDCGQTFANNRFCCPQNSVCQSNGYDRLCCSAQDSFANCLNTFSATPKCAKSSWVLLDNAGYFCCPTGTRGLRVIVGNDIRSVCAPETGFTVENATFLDPVVVSSGL